MEGQIDKNQNQQLLGEGLGLVVIFMIILIVKANTPVHQFWFGALFGMWLAHFMFYLGAVGKAYVWKRR